MVAKEIGGGPARNLRSRAPETNKRFEESDISSEEVKLQKTQEDKRNTKKRVYEEISMLQKPEILTKALTVDDARTNTKES